MSRKGFTLVEVTVVLAILSLMAAVVLPRYVALQAGQESRDFSSALVRLGSDARLLAIQTGQAVRVVYREEDGVLVLSTINPETLAETEVRTIPVPLGLTLSSFTLDGSLSSATDWILEFYPDGSGLDAGVEVEEGNTVYHVLIEGDDGRATKTEGRLEEGANNEWEAGELEQRI